MGDDRPEPREETPIRDSRKRGHRRPLIIGIGQELRGDDAVGRRVAERFAALHPDTVDVESLTQLTPELVETISLASKVVFVDAQVGGAPGTIRIETVDGGSNSSAGLSHVAAPEDLLAYASGLFGYSPDAAIITISGSCFELGGELSPMVELAVGQAVDAIREWLEFRGGRGDGGSAISAPFPESSASS